MTAFDLKKNCAATRSSSDEAFLANCERDRRSIFVGDLPPSTEQDELEELFSAAGEILKINVIQRPANMNSTSGFAPAVRTMAFVEYAQPDMPEIAIAKFQGETYKGATLRVERKSVKDRGPTPRHSRSSLLLAHKPSNESVYSPGPAAPASATRERFFPQQERVYQHQAQPVSPAIMSTPHCATPHRRAFSQQPRVDVASPAGAMPTPMYGNVMGGFGNMSPYHNTTTPGGNYTFGPGGAGPMTPHSPGMPNMPSPWSYYTGYWPGLLGTYDPSMYVNPYAFQSTGNFQSSNPMMGGGGAASSGLSCGAVAVAAAAATGDEGEGHESTPTRVKSDVSVKIEDAEECEKV